MKHNNCKTKNCETYCDLNTNRPDCNMPVRKHLQPVLVARIYNQPIVEEVPFSSMSMTLDNTASISSLSSNILPLCGDYTTCLPGRGAICDNNCDTNRDENSEFKF